MDYQSFVNSSRSLLIAPAGYGKTFTIAECMKYTSGKQLILTHTHAGITSIRNKIKEHKIPAEKYSVETISSFAQKYVNAYFLGDIPAQETKQYHPFIIEQARAIVSTPIVKKVLSTTYSGIFVDEYQDCTYSQHLLLMEIGSLFPIHILGDPLQGIFDFNGKEKLVDFKTDLIEFEKFKLNTPYRWNNVGKQGLANSLEIIRGKLERQEAIDFKEFESCDFHFVSAKLEDIRDEDSLLRKCLDRLLRKSVYESLLFIVPSHFENGVLRGGVTDRSKLKNCFDFQNQVQLLEAIDDESFYKNAKKIDELYESIGRAKNKYNKIKKDLLYKYFRKGDVNAWFNDDALKAKRTKSDQILSIEIKEHLEDFISSPSIFNCKSILELFNKKFKFKTARPELYRSVVSAMESAIFDSKSVEVAMREQRNRLRQNGRSIKGKCIGTTLLTKGLEFDTVAIFDLHKFECPKNLYVALTRSCKKLIIFSDIEIWQAKVSKPTK